MNRDTSTRMSRGHKGHASANKASWSSHSKGKMAVAATSVGQVDGTSTGADLLLKDLEVLCAAWSAHNQEGEGRQSLGRSAHG